MATILISSPGDDPPKSYARYYLRLFAEKAAEEGHRAVIIREPLLGNFEDAIKKYNPRFVIVNGHGGRKGVTGADYHVILGVKGYDPELRLQILAQNPELMKGRIVYLLSCFSGKELAPRLAQYGAIAVAAYKSAFIFLSENSPEKDLKSRRFFTAALQLPLLLIKGREFAVGCNAVRKTFLRYTEEAEKAGDDLMGKYCYHNYLNFKCFGYTRAKL